MVRPSAKPYSMVARNGEVLPPPLKWAGGKRWQLPHLRKYWERESHRRLVEPFCGGLTVTLGLKPERALLNDVNPHLFNFYCWMQRGLRITIDLKYEEAIFYRHRSRFNELLHKGTTTTREAASLFYYLNRTAYNGLCRFNRSFIRAYAKFVGYDEQEAIDEYASEQEAIDEVAIKPHKSLVYTDTGGGRSPLVTLLLAVIILAVLSLLVWAGLHFYQRSVAPKTQPSRTSRRFAPGQSPEARPSDRAIGFGRAKTGLKEDAHEFSA